MNGNDRRRISEAKIKNNVNLWGKSFKDSRRNYIYVSHERRSRYRLYIKIKSLKSGQENFSLYDNLKKGKSPFYEKTKLGSLEIVNNVGKKFGFTCIKIKGTKRRTMKVWLYFPSLNQTFVGNYMSVKNGCMPMDYGNAIQKQKITKKLTKLGLSLPKDEMFFPVQVFMKNHHYKAVIKHCLSNKTHEIWCDDVIYWNKSPFSADYKYDEKNKAHKKLKKILNNEGIEYSYETKLTSNLRIDFVIKIKDKKIGIEVKSDVKFWSPTDLNKQMFKYIDSGKLDQLVLSSPKGRYGLSFKDTLNYLKDLIYEN